MEQLAASTIALPMPWVAMPLAAIGVFVVALVAFHVLLVFVYPLSALSWRFVDYIWLVLGLLGILTTVGSNWSSAVSQRLVDVEAVARWRQSAVVADVEYARSIVCRRLGPRSELQDASTYEQAWAEQERACNILRLVSPQLEAWVVGGLDPLRDVVADDVDLEDALSRAFGRMPSSERLYESARIEHSLLIAKSNELWPLSLRLWGPFMLAISLALRVTKVTGEIVLAKRQA